jgi:cation diffusion facilitator family transporter
MSVEGSNKIIIISLLANLGIAIAKLIGALFTKSAALLAEAVHSFSDCGNQILLLYAQRIAKKGVSQRYPLGRGKELFFWSFVVALLLFSMGGIFSIYEGINKIKGNESINNPLVAILILCFAVILEGYSFFVCYNEVQKQNTYESIWQWIKKTTSADLLVIFLEDLAALIGLAIALISLTISWLTGNAIWDGIGSLVIGVLLIIVAIILASEVKPMLIGEAPHYNYQEEMTKILKEVMPEATLLRVIALQQGINSVLMAYKIHPGDTLLDTVSTIKLVNSFEYRVKQKFPEIKWQFAELDLYE